MHIYDCTRHTCVDALMTRTPITITDALCNGGRQYSYLLRRTCSFSWMDRTSTATTLRELCVRVLLRAKDSIGHVGSVPVEMLRPVLERFDANQLAEFEVSTASMCLR